jgi:hypothetical protein
MGTGLDGNPEPDGACGVPGLYPVLKKCLWFLKRIHVLKFFNKLSLVFSMNINSAVYHANKCYYSCRLCNAAGYYQITQITIKFPTRRIDARCYWPVQWFYFIQNLLCVLLLSNLVFVASSKFVTSHDICLIHHIFKKKKIRYSYYSRIIPVYIAF